MEILAIYGADYFIKDSAASGGYANYLGNARGWRRTSRQRVNRIGRLARGRQLLDVGAACGFFVLEARANGFEATGMEISEWASEWARSTLGMPVATGGIEDLPRGEQFDVITAWEVIEHVADPVGFLTGAVTRLRPGGLLAISTPDYTARVPRMLGSRWMGWTKVPEHVSFFSRQSVEFALRQAGLQIRRATYTPTHVAASYLLDRLRFQATGSSRPLRLPWDPVVRVNPGWDLEVLASKP